MDVRVVGQWGTYAATAPKTVTSTLCMDPVGWGAVVASKD